VTPSKGAQRDEPPSRRTGRHPSAHHAELRFTDAAIDDLVAVQKRNRPALTWAMKKFLLIERNPEAGAPLGGGLHGYRKLTVGDRDWRIVWRVTSDDTGQLIVDIGEIWAVGARKDSEVYTEMRRRVAALHEGPQTKTFEEVLALLEASLTKKRRPAPSHPTTDDTPAPTWLVDDLVNLAGYARSDVEALTERQAMSAWVAYRSR
jgi:mRNA interferase RelE/StbE